MLLLMFILSVVYEKNLVSKQSLLFMIHMTLETVDGFVIKSTEVL